MTQLKSKGGVHFQILLSHLTDSLSSVWQCVYSGFTDNGLPGFKHRINRDDALVAPAELISTQSMENKSSWGDGPEAACVKPACAANSAAQQRPHAGRTPGETAGGVRYMGVSVCVHHLGVESGSNGGGRRRGE